MHNYTYGAGRRKERRKLYNCDRMSMEISYGKRQRETETRSISCDMLIIAMKRDNDRYEKYASNRFLNRASTSFHSDRRVEFEDGFLLNSPYTFQLTYTDRHLLVLEAVNFNEQLFIVFRY